MIINNMKDARRYKATYSTSTKDTPVDAGGSEVDMYVRETVRTYDILGKEVGSEIVSVQFVAVTDEGVAIADSTDEALEMALA